MIINRRIILITLISLILSGCGYTPLYTSKQNIKICDIEINDYNYGIEKFIK